MTRFDVVIVGGGPAGLSAAVWAADLGLTAALIEKREELGGQLLQIHNPVTNYLGVTAENGKELRDLFVAAAQNSRFERICRRTVVGVSFGANCVTLDDGRMIGWGGLVAATGVRRRKLGIPGEDDLVGKGVLASGVAEKTKVKNKRVVVVGGGDAALENALILDEYATHVTLVHRGSEFRARKEFLQKANDAVNISILRSTIPKTIHGTDRVEGVGLLDTTTGRSWKVEADFVLVRIGVVPNSEWLVGTVDLDSEGYVKVNEVCETSKPRIYACGDLASPGGPTISAAVGQASTAIKSLAAVVSVGQTSS